MTQKSDGWRHLSLGDLCRTYSGSTPLRTNPAFFGPGIPWIKSGELNHGEICEAEESITEEGLRHSAARIVEPGTNLIALYGATAGVVGRVRIRAAINQAVLAVVPRDEQVLPDYLEFLLEKVGTECIRLVQGAQPNLNAGLVEGQGCCIPPRDEQARIASILQTWNEAIKKSKKLLSLHIEVKHSLMQQLLSGRKRFKAFDEEQWRRLRLQEVATESSLRNNGNLDRKYLMAVTKAEGIIPMRERVQGKSFERCKIVKPGWFAYNPMRLNIGSIAQWRGEHDVMVSGDYVVFYCNKDQLDHRYLEQFRRTHQWESFVRRSGNGSVRVRIWFSDLGHLKMELPSLAEQNRIVTALETYDREIELLQRQLVALRKQRYGLMQKLLTGEIRVKIPKGA